MRRILGILTVALAIAAGSPASAGHGTQQCTGTAPVLVGAPAGCTVWLGCPSTHACLVSVTGTASGAGLISVTVKLGGLTLGSCGPAAAGCSVTAPQNLPPGAPGIPLTCEVSGPALNVAYTCRSTASGHV